MTEFDAMTAAAAMVTMAVLRAVGGGSGSDKGSGSGRSSSGSGGDGAGGSVCGGSDIKNDDGGGNGVNGGGGPWKRRYWRLLTSIQARQLASQNWFTQSSERALSV